MQYSSPAWRALIAVAMVIGFYALALVIMFLLLFIPSALALFLFIRSGLWMPICVVSSIPLGFCAIAALEIGLGLVPRLYHFDPRGPRLAAKEQPALFAVLTETARAVGQAGPLEVFLVSDLTAWVKERGGVLGFGSRRAVGLGLPLLQILSVLELRAVLAHEFGRYCSEDVRLNPLIDKTHFSIRCTIASLDLDRREFKIGFFVYGPLEAMFSAYGGWFFNITQAVSLGQEYSADALAARAVGVEPLVRGLRTIHNAMPALWAYIEQEVSPVVNAGYRPRLAEGFARFIQAPSVASTMARALEEEIKTGKAYFYDTRPLLRDRLARLETFPAGKSMADDRPAISLLQNVPELEKHLLPYITYVPGNQELPVVEWDQVGTVVYLPSYRRMLEEHAAVLRGITPVRLPEAMASTRFIDYLASIGWLEGYDEDEVDPGAKFGKDMVGAALVNLLIQRGWSIQFVLGMPVTLRLGEDQIEPFTIVPRLVDHSLTAEAWREECRAHGIADVDLGSVPVAIEQETKKG